MKRLLEIYNLVESVDLSIDDESCVLREAQEIIDKDNSPDERKQVRDAAKRS